MVTKSEQELRSSGKMMEVRHSSYRQNLFLDPMALQHFLKEGYFFLDFFPVFFFDFFPVFPGFCTGRKGGRKEGRKEGKMDRKEGRKEGRQAGRKEGRKEGRQAGRKEGRKAGRQAGRKEGRQAGRKEGRKEVSRMLFILCQLNEWLHPKTSEVT